MPELPEVETIVNQLNQVLKNRKIEEVVLIWPKVVQGTVSLNKLKEILKGAKIIKVFRRAKNILIELNNNYLLLIHLKLTGRILYGKKEFIEKDPYLRFYLILDNDNFLALSDLRKFAKIVLLKKEDLNTIKDLKGIGPEPLDNNFSFEKFKEIILKKKKKIKEVLMDQKVIAGIGNIYANEILWEAKINPFRLANSLKEKELQELFNSIRKILKLAIKYQGSTIADEMYRNIYGEEGNYGKIRKVYQREGEMCFRCKSKILRKTQAGRSTFYCPKCQT
ncbi:MAG: DNA-formamidopyrimidine glycosylase [Minisyncoccia bacterium]